MIAPVHHHYPHRVQGATAEAVDRFWSRIVIGAAGDCWEWQGTTSSGYGNLAFAGKTQRAHRVAYQIAHGPIAEGLCVCHRCDNRLCCNPAHLFLGTKADNSADMAAKRRSANSTTRLTPTQVDEIRRRYATGGVLQRELGAAFGVSRSMVSAIVRRERWA